MLNTAINNFATTLAKDCTSADTTITLTDVTGLPSAGVLTFADNNEIVHYTAISGNDLTVERGYDGTTASAHSAGCTVEMRYIAEHYNGLKNEIINHETNTNNPHQVKLKQDSSPKLGGDLDRNGHIVVADDGGLSDNLFNKIIQSQKIIKLISFDTYDMVQNAVAGSGYVVQNLGVGNVRTGTTANSYARQNFNTQSGTGLYVGDKYAWYLYVGGLTGDTVAFVGHIRNVLLDTQTDHTLTAIHAGLFYDNGKFYASTADGTNQQLTDVTSLVSWQNWLKITYDGINVKFYWGDTLIATHTTYSPSYGYQQVWISNKANAVNNTLQFYNFFRRGLA